METCEIDGCDRPHLARDWCSRHYKRWRRHGDPLGGGIRHESPEASWLAHTEPRGECLVWTGDRYSDGYGRISAGGRQMAAHRYAWEREHGPLAEGVKLDHRCWDHSCVNVEHLRPATSAENNASLSGPKRHNVGTGVRNVYPHGERYRVLITAGGVRHNLGMFGTIQEAQAVAEAGRARLFGEFAGAVSGHRD